VVDLGVSRVAAGFIVVAKWVSKSSSYSSYCDWTLPNTKKMV